MNHVQMQATLIERSALRFTPAGIPVVEAQLQHRSFAMEAGLQRRLEFDFAAIAIGETAQQLAGAELGSELGLSGFLAPRSRRSTRLLVHVLEFSRLAGTGSAADSAADATGVATAAGGAADGQN